MAQEDYDRIYLLLQLEKLTDLTIFLEDGTQKIQMDVHRMVLVLHCPYFEKLLLFGEIPQSLNLKVPNVNAAYDLLMSFYKQKTNRGKYSYWLHQLLLAKCLDYFSLEVLMPTIPEKISADNYDYILQLAEIVGFDDELLKNLTEKLPLDYDPSLLSQDLIQKMLDTTTYAVIDKGCGIVLRNILDGAFVINLGSDTNIIELAFSISIKYIAAIKESNITIWDVYANRLIYSMASTYYKFITTYNCVDFTIDEKSIIVSFNEGSIEIHNFIEERIRYKFSTGYAKPISFVKLTPNNQYLITQSYDAIIKIWDGDTYALKHTVNFDNTIYRLNISPDSQYLFVINDNGINIYNIASGSKKYIGDIDEFSAIYQFRYLVKIQLDESFDIWDINTDQLIHVFDKYTIKGCYIHNVVLSPSKYILLSDSDNFGQDMMTYYTNHALHIYDIASGELCISLNSCISANFSEDFHYLAILTESTIIIMDFINKKILNEIDHCLRHSYTYPYLGFSDNNKYFAYQKYVQEWERSKIYFYDTLSGEYINTIEADEYELFSTKIHMGPYERLKPLLKN